MTINIFDMVIAIIAVVIIADAVIKGFVRSAIRLIRPIAAVTASGITSGLLGTVVYTSLVRPRLTAYVSNKINEAGTPADFVKSLLEKDSSGILKDKFGDIASSQLADTDKLTTFITDNLLEGIATGIVKGVIFLLTSLIVFIIFLIISKHFKELTKKNKTIGKADKFVGGVFGLINAVVVVIGVCTAAQLIISVLGNVSVLNEKVSASPIYTQLLESKIISSINTYNPLTKLLEV